MAMVNPKEGMAGIKRGLVFCGLRALDFVVELRDLFVWPSHNLPQIV